MEVNTKHSIGAEVYVFGKTEMGIKAYKGTVTKIEISVSNDKTSVTYDVRSPSRTIGLRKEDEIFTSKNTVKEFIQNLI